MIETKTPRQYAQGVVAMSDEFAKYSGEYANMIKSRARFFKDNRSSYKSDTATQRSFELTDDGVKMEVVKAKLKSLEKLMSAYKTMIRLAETESFNIL